MAKKNLILLVGPALPTIDRLHEELGRRPETLAAAGLTVPPVVQADLFRAGVEIRRTHKSEGMRRKDVEGAWARVVRTAEKTRRDVVIAQESYAEASAEQIALLMDALAGFRVHVVLTPTAGRPGLDDLIEPWTALVAAPRLHVLTLQPGDDVDSLLSRISGLALAERPGRSAQRGWRAERFGTKPATRATSAGNDCHLGGQGQPPRRQWGCQASSSAVRLVTTSGNRPSES